MATSVSTSGLGAMAVASAGSATAIAGTNICRDRVVAIVFPHKPIDVPGLGRVPEIGHAGVLLINGTTGLTKYFDYGRYGGPIGVVRNLRIPNVTMNSGEPTDSSMKVTLRALAADAGEKTPLRCVSFLAENKFSTGLDHCQGRLNQNNDPTRPPYSILTNNCVSFTDETVKLCVTTWARMNMPLYNPIPHAYIVAIQTFSRLVPDARNYDYDFTSDTLI